MGRRLHPDRALEIALTGCARRHAFDGTPRAEALEELRLLAKGRSDLLAEACGLVLGGYLALPGSQHPGILHAAALLAEAGADPRLVAGFADKARDNALRNHHTTGDIGGAPNDRFD